MKTQPIESRAWIEFSPWCDVLVPRNVGQGVSQFQSAAQSAQGCVLRRFKAVAFEPFEFYTNRIIVAVVAPAVRRRARMPCPLVAVDKLQNFARASDEKMRRYAHTA